MAIIDRLGRLFRADVHAVLDRMEEPEVLLRQAIREMDEELAGNVARLKARELELAHCARRAEEVRAALGKLGGELDLAFGAGNEALARTLLRRRLELERMATHLEQRGTALTRSIAEQRERVDAQRRELDAMRQKAELFDTEPAHADDVCVARRDGAEFVVTDADVELALLRERQQRGAP